MCLGRDQVASYFVLIDSLVGVLQDVVGVDANGYFFASRCGLSRAWR